MTTFDMTKELGGQLLTIKNPARYIGGEYRLGTSRGIQEASLFVGICFPDLYEIGMSNNAVRILYDLVSSMDAPVLCDRVFSVAPDYETLLKERNLPLCTLDHGIPLNELSLLGISVGYELTATNILQVLDLGGIPLHAKERREGDPIVIAGGPAVTNPLPFSSFFDFVFIGEAEQGLVEIIETMRSLKDAGASRADMIESLNAFDYLWYYGKRLAVRAVDDTFSGSSGTRFNHYVVPHFKVAQDNGVVEIMRGCPNGCRFCHAGQYYKPYRQKSYFSIASQVEQLVQDLGYREITLSSLSSGDHPQLGMIINNLNARYASSHVSFSLPSLKVSSFSLDILEQLSEVRKSGLTFAIETPLSKWQRAVNKEVPLDQVIDILREAKNRGWRSAKFYFMVGLPFIDPDEEKQAIIDFIQAIHDATRIGMSINIGTFIPKAHTPFQWARQLTPEFSRDHLMAVKQGIQEQVRQAKVSYHEPWISYIEGIISRGDERTGRLIEHAYRTGCRLDAWDEHFDRDGWKLAINAMDFSVDSWMFSAHDPEEPLPWDSVSLGVSKRYLRQEWDRARDAILTDRCAPDCRVSCGVCGKTHRVFDVTESEKFDTDVSAAAHVAAEASSKPPQPVLFFYRKEGKAVYISHINVMRVFEQTFQRAGVSVAFTQGYNPKPRMEFVNPLSIGISGSAEVLLVDIHGASTLDEHHILQSLNASVSEGFEFTAMRTMATTRRITLSKHLGGSVYTVSHVSDASVRRKLDDRMEKNDRTVIVTRQREGENSVYTVVCQGETNAVKALFGTEVDKFAILSSLHLHRERLYVGSYDEKRGYSTVGLMWQ